MRRKASVLRTIVRRGLSRNGDMCRWEYNNKNPLHRRPWSHVQHTVVNEMVKIVVNSIFANWRGNELYKHDQPRNQSEEVEFDE